MATRSLKPLIQKMKADKRYKRLSESFDTLPMYQLACDELTKEIMTLHQLREVRRLNSQAPGFVDAVVKANTCDQSMRSRLTEIMMTCTSATSSLEDAVESLRHHLLLTFTHDLREFRTKEERSQVVARAVLKFTKYLRNIAVLKEIAALAIKDIDQAAWSLKTHINALELHTQREGRL